MNKRNPLDGMAVAAIPFSLAKTCLTMMIAAVLLCWLFIGCERSGTSSKKVVRVSGATMGTSYQVTTLGLPSAFDDEADWQAAIDGALEQVNDQMSTYREDSEISRFNRSESPEWFDVSADTMQVAARAQEICERSGGAFDATVMPLVNLWSFGPQARPATIPTEAEIAQAQESVGCGLFEVRRDPPAIRKLSSEVQIDFSAIAKGFGVDQIARLCEREGLENYFVEIGGEVRTKGSRADGGRWRIGVEAPLTDQRKVDNVLQLHDGAVATSGSYRNYFEADGIRYSHTIDPRTGRPISHALVSVTVIANDCATADAWATTLMVLGPDEGYNYAERLGLAAQFIVKAEDGFERRMSPGFVSRGSAGE